MNAIALAITALFFPQMSQYDLCGNVGGSKYSLGCGGVAQVADLERDSNQYYSNANIDINGAIDLTIFGCFTQETSSLGTLVGHMGNGAGEKGFGVHADGNSTGRVGFQISEDGSTITTHNLSNGIGTEFDYRTCFVFVFEAGVEMRGTVANENETNFPAATATAITSIFDATTLFTVGAEEGGARERHDGKLGYIGVYASVGSAWSAADMSWFAAAYDDPKKCADVAARITGDPTHCYNELGIAIYGGEELTEGNGPISKVAW